MSDETEQVLYTVERTVARITLNRPEKRNALNAWLVGRLKQVLRDAEQNDVVRVVVLAGAGADFCAGADLTELQKSSENSVVENLADAERLMELFTLIRELHVPVVAAVRGRALAGGCGLATACDIVLATRSASFGYPEVRIGFVPAMVMAILRRNVSEKRAFELIARGAQIDASEAERFGLINQVFDDATYDADVDGYVAGLAKNSRSAVMLTKRLLYHIDGMTFEAAVRSGAHINAIARVTEDCQQGIKSFLQK